MKEDIKRHIEVILNRNTDLDSSILDWNKLVDEIYEYFILNQNGFRTEDY